METERVIPLNPRFFDWLVSEIQQIQRGSIHLDVEDGKLRTIGCHGHRFLHTPEDLERPRR